VWLIAWSYNTLTLIPALGYFKPVLLKRKGVALCLWGEAGIGKSHTTQKLLESLTCRYLSLHASSSLASLAKALLKPKKLATWAARSLERLEQGETLETSAITNALGTTLAGLAPFVLHLEDIHEVDSERLILLRELAQTVQRTKGVGLLITSRKEPSEPFHSVRLEPLSVQASDELLAQELTAVLPTEASQWIYSKAAGNPLYTLEYLRYLARQGYLWNDGKNWRWRQPGQGFMPVTIEALIEQQLSQARTSEMSGYVLEARAFLPLEITSEVWMKVARVSQEELQRAIETLQQESIFRENYFIHPLYREVTLQTLKQPRRQHLARRIINALQDAPESMALYVDDANLAKEQALELLTKAARHAREANKNLQAGHLLAKAVPYADGEQKGKLALGAAHLLDGLDYPRMLELATQASHFLAEPSEALYLQAVALALQGKYEATQQVVRLVPDSSKQGKLWLQRYLRLLHLTAKHKELVEFWESQTPLQEQTDGVTVYSVAWAYIHLGNFSAASALVADWLAKPDLTPFVSWNLLEVQATIAFYQGNYQEAELYFSQALELSRQLPSSNNLFQDVANILRNRSVTRLQLGRYGESLPDLQEALRIYSDSGNSIYYAQTLVMTSYLYAELGETEKTEDVLLEALDIFNRVTPQPFLCHTLVQLSELYAESPQRIYLAKKYATEALRVASEVTDTSCLTLATYALARVDYAASNYTKALELASEALELATRIENFEAVLTARVTRGLALQHLGQVAEAKKEITLAYEAATARGMVLEANKFGLELDRLNDDVKSARTRMQWFEERGLINGVNIAKRYFPELALQNVESDKLESTSEVRLDVLGTMRLTLENKIETVQGRKRQELLALLLEAKLSEHAEVNRLELFDTLYADKNEQLAANSLKELVSTLRDRLGVNAITTTATGYALGAVQSDAEVFLQTGDTTLWRGVYLEDVALESQKTVAESLYFLLYSKAQEILEANPKEAARVARVLLEADPYNQDYLKLSLQALRASNNHKSLTRLYAESKERFVEVGETLPEQWQQFLGS
jgi:tetratricopeptide (TPR) repeat protein